MGLLDTRSRLMSAVSLSTFANMVRDRYADALELIDKWFADYKAWEKDDSFDTAWKESRLTYRGVKANALERKFPLKAHAGEGGKEKEFTQKLSVGMNSVLDRMKPEHFVPPKKPEDLVPSKYGASRKVELGLHDVSASLIDPRRGLTTQAFKQAFKNGDSVVFMPLGEPEDQRVLDYLLVWAKKLDPPNLDLNQRLREIRSQMTRIKYAAENDLGANFTALKPDNPVNPKFRYRPGGAARVYDAELTEKAKEKAKKENSTLLYPGRTKLVQTTPEIIHMRHLAALDYKSILTQRFKYNEIVIAYREHANKDFPMYGVLDLPKLQWTIYKLNADGTAGALIKVVGDKPT
jgi:hypothetical protein